MTLSPSPSTPLPARKRGGQHGNKNALKHGFYSNQLEGRDRSDLSNLSPYSLDSEIALLRVLMRRILQSSRGVTDYEKLTILLRGYTLASVAVSRLLHIRFLILGQTDEQNARLLEAARDLDADSKAGDHVGADLRVCPSLRVCPPPDQATSTSYDPGDGNNPPAKGDNPPVEGGNPPQ